MPIKYIKGSLLDTDAKIIVHGCNCQGVMGSGVAKQIKEKYPQAYNAYKNYEESVGLKLGYVIPAFCTGGRWVLNCLTQEYYGRNVNKVYVDYNAISRCFREVASLCNYFIGFNKSYKYNLIAMPKIGCGLANGDWNIVSKIIEEELCDKGFEVLVYEL